MDTNDASVEEDHKKNPVEILTKEKVYIGPIVLQVFLIEAVLAIIVMLLAGFSIYTLVFGVYAAFYIFLGSFVGALFGKLTFGTRPAAYFGAILFSLLALGLGYQNLTS